MPVFLTASFNFNSYLTHNIYMQSTCKFLLDSFRDYPKFQTTMFAHTTIDISFIINFYPLESLKYLLEKHYKYLNQIAGKKCYNKQLYKHYYFISYNLEPVFLRATLKYAICTV